MRICLTGGLGFLGSVLTEKLASEGFLVDVIDRSLYGKYIDDKKLGVKLHNNDIRDVGKFQDVIENCDAIVHLAAIVGDPACDFIKEKSVDINLNATKRIADTAKKFGKPFIYTSTCSVYGASRTTDSLREDSPTLPLSIYGLTKYGSEEYVRRNLDKFVILRLGTAFGFSPRMRFDLVINKFVLDGMAKGELTIFGGKQYRPFVHVTDICNSIIKVLESENFDHQLVNVGGFNHTVGGLGEVVSKLTKCKMKVFPEINDPRNYVIDSSRLKEQFNYKPKMDIEDGIKEIQKSLKGDLNSFYDAKYTNIEYIKANLEKMGI